MIIVESDLGKKEFRDFLIDQIRKGMDIRYGDADKFSLRFRIRKLV